MTTCNNKITKLVGQKYIKYDSVPGLCKRFDKNLLDKFDAPARAKIKEILGEFVQDNPNIYEQDLIIVSPTCKYKFLELQVCTNWINQKFPYDYVYLYARKARYGKDTIFMTINRFLSRAYLFDYASIEGIKPKRIKKYSRTFVYHIPWRKALYVDLELLDKELIESY